MDLRQQYPRSPRETLSGYVHVPRMVDKCRAFLAGTLGEYVYPCSMDQQLLNFAGITAQQFTDAVRGLHTDEKIGEWLNRTAASRSAGEVRQFNEALLARGPDAPEKWATFKKTRDTIDASRQDIVSWADLLDLEEGRPVPKRS